MVRIFYLILPLLLFLSCQSAPDIPDDTVVVGIEIYPDVFDPRYATDAMSTKINQLVFSGLMDSDEHQNLVPDLAKDYEVSGGRVYSFTLKPQIFFHNGKKLTSRDVKATYESMMREDFQSPYFGSLKVIERIETPSDDVIVFYLKESYLPFLTLMTKGVLPEEVAVQKKLPLEKLVGTGPFAFSLQQKPREKIYLSRHQTYYRDPAKPKEVIFWAIQDNTLRAMELLKGRVDLVQNSIPFVLVPHFKKQKNLTFAERVGINMTYMALHFGNRHLADPKVRQAMAHAIDRQSLIRYKLKDLGSSATSVLNPDHWAFYNELKPFEFDLDGAKKLLDDTAYKDPDGDGPKTRFDLVYKTSTNRERLEIAQLIAENLRKIGIGVSVKPYEFGTFYRDIRQGDFDMFTLTWVGLTDPDIYYFIAHSSQVPPAGMNRGHYKNQELDALLVASRQENDVDKRKAIYADIQKIFYNDFVYIPLWYEKNYVFMNRRLEGYSLRPDASFLGLVHAKKTGVKP